MKENLPNIFLTVWNCRQVLGKKPVEFTKAHPAATSEKVRGAEIIFGNDYDVIDVQSTMIQPLCYDQLTN